MMFPTLSFYASLLKESFCCTACTSSQKFLEPPSSQNLEHAPMLIPEMARDCIFEEPVESPNMERPLSCESREEKNSYPYVFCLLCTVDTCYK